MRKRKKENDYQAGLIKRIKHRFDCKCHECMVLKNDANYIQGIPDLIVLIGDKWATLEVKRSEKERRRPNQEYYVEKMNGMSFSRVIYPENEEEVLNEIQSTFCL